MIEYHVVVDEGKVDGDHTAILMAHYEDGKLVIDLNIVQKPDVVKQFLNIIREGQYRINR